MLCRVKIPTVPSSWEIPPYLNYPVQARKTARPILALHHTLQGYQSNRFPQLGKSSLSQLSSPETWKQQGQFSPCTMLCRVKSPTVPSSWEIPPHLNYPVQTRKTARPILALHHTLQGYQSNCFPQLGKSSLSHLPNPNRKTARSVIASCHTLQG